MRPIKFRAYDTDDKVMRSWKEIDFIKDAGDDYYMVGYKASTVLVKYDHKQIPMQFIGRTGMNENDDEVDIFEGDIIQVIEQGQPMGFYVENEYVGVVEYDQGHCTYYLNLIKTNYHNELPDEIDGIPIFKGDEEPERYYFNGDLFLVPEDIQILGNIYENPELVEELEQWK